MTNVEWLVPFKGRSHSGPYNQNFLWKSDSVYVMDNHRAALWCWNNEIDLSNKHSLLHVDQHTDTLQSQLDVWLKHLPPCTASIEDYLAKTYVSVGTKCPVIRWDNYLSIYFSKFNSSIDNCFFATHHDGDEPNFDRVHQVDMWNLPNVMGGCFYENSPWIVNIDLDYFYFETDSEIAPIVSDKYLEICFESLRKAIDNKLVAVTTICLTPDEPFTPGWEQSEKLASRILDILGKKFELPD